MSRMHDPAFFAAKNNFWFAKLYQRTFEMINVLTDKCHGAAWLAEE